MEKKSFLVYFDMYPQIVGLPAEQKGELLAALFEYADAERKAAGSGEAVLEAHPAMTPETRMAFGFMRETIRRDTKKWREKQQRYQEAARRRWEEQGEQKRPLPPNRVNWKPSDAQDIWKYVE